MSAAARMNIFCQVGEERTSQDAKWGEQNHPNGTGGWMQKVAADGRREATERLFAEGAGTWADVLSEEYYEVLAESDPITLRKELIQLAAVAVAWIEAIDRAAWIEVYPPRPWSEADNPSTYGTAA